mgnify:CR=1 FL=1
MYFVYRSAYDMVVPIVEMLCILVLITFPFVVKPVIKSISCLFRISIRRLFWIKKSAPNIGSGMSAIMNDHRNLRRNSRSMSPMCRPYVGIGVEFAAKRVRLVSLDLFLNKRTGSKETIDPESIRYRSRVFTPCKCNRASLCSIAVRGTLLLFTA